MQSNDRQDSAQRLSRSLVGLSAVALLAAGSLSFAAEAVKQDSEVAAEYKSEAAQLRDEAEHHRKLALTTRAGLLRRDRGVMRALRKTGFTIFARYQKCGLEGLTDRSRRPQRHANQLPFQIEARIVQLGLIEKTLPS